MLGLILIIVLIVALFGSFPRYGYSRNWGYGPSGGICLVLAIVIILVLLRYIQAASVQAKFRVVSWSIILKTLPRNNTK